MDLRFAPPDQPTPVDADLIEPDHRSVRAPVTEREPVSFVCPRCGWYIDSPAHQHGCRGAAA